MAISPARPQLPGGRDARSDTGADTQPSPPATPGGVVAHGEDRAPDAAAGGRPRRGPLALLRHLGGLLSQTAHEFAQDDGPWLAAAMAYYAAFSLFPLLLVFVAAFGYFLQVSASGFDAQQQLLALIAINTSPSLARLLEQVLHEVKTDAPVGGPIGLAGLLLAAVGIFGALDAAFDRLWNIPPATVPGLLATLRYHLRQRLVAFAMLIALGLLLLVAFFGGLAVAALGRYAAQGPAGAAGREAIQILIAIAVDALLFAVIYKVLPKARVQWRHALAGGLLASLVWEVGKLVLAAIVIGQHYSAYGVVGAFIALMAWVFYASLIFFWGAEFVQVMGQPARAGPPHPPAPEEVRPVPTPAAPPEPTPPGERARYAQPLHRTPW